MRASLQDACLWTTNEQTATCLLAYRSRQATCLLAYGSDSDQGSRQATRGYFFGQSGRSRPAT